MSFFHPSSPCQDVDFTWMLAVCLVCRLHTKYLKEEVSLFQIKTNPCLSLLSLTHIQTHTSTEEFCLTGLLSVLCVCVNTTGENTGWRLVIPGVHPTVYVVFESPDWLLINNFSSYKQVMTICTFFCFNVRKWGNMPFTSYLITVAPSNHWYRPNILKSAKGFSL